MKLQLKTTLFIVLIFGLALFFRFYSFTNVPPGLYPDEAMNGNNALEILNPASPNGGFKVFYPENNGREGLLINIQAVLLKYLIPFAGQPEPWMLRLPSAIFGLFSVVGLYFLGKEMFRSGKIAMLSAFFIAISFWHINFSRMGFRAILAPFFLIWSLCFLFKSLSERNGQKPILNGALIAALGGILYGLGFYTYIAYRATPVIILAVLLWLLFTAKESRQNFWRATGIFILLAILVALPLGLYFLKNPADFFGRTSEISIVSSSSPLLTLLINTAKTAGMFNIAGDYNWRHNISGAPELFWPVGIVFVIGFFYGLINLFRKNDNRFPLIITFIWLGIAAAPVILSNEGIPHALRAILMIPPAFLIAGFGAEKFYDFLKDKTAGRFPVRLLPIVAGLFSIFIVISVYRDYFVFWSKNPEVAGAFNQNYVDIGRELNALPKATPKYVIVEAGGVDVRGRPMPAQTIMYLTDTFTPEKQTAKNIRYLKPEEANLIPSGGFTVTIR